MKDLIMISGPYSHQDPAVKAKRFRTLASVCGWMMNHGEIVFSPVVYGLSVIAEGDYKLPDSNTFWKEYCDVFTSHCKKVYVINMTGWDISSGVKAEIDTAKENGIPVFLVDIDMKNDQIEFIREI